jgi:hypothetical protein
MSKRVGALLGIALGAMGCQGASQEGSAGKGFVLLDRDARAAGFVLESEGQRLSSALPRELLADDDASLIGPTGRTSLAGADGELLHVRGRDGRLESLDLGDEADADRVLVVGTREAASALAEMLGAGMVEKDGGWELSARGVLAAAAAVDDAPGVTEILPAKLEAKGTNDDATVDGRASQRLPGLVGEQPFADVMARVREAEAALQRFDLPPAVHCADPVAGTWMTQQYDAGFQDWYVFTVQIERGAEGALTGNIEAHSWDGDAHQDTAPESCDGRSHWFVSMPATGTIEGNLVQFGATSWRPEASLCGRIPGPGEYNLDQFTGALDGGRYLSVNNDGGRMKDAPSPFRRVACN